MGIKALKGTSDILPDAVGIWQAIEKAARRLFAIYGYGEVRTPIIEETSLFQRSIGASSDIVSKQMYTFLDRGGRSISLRPEATAGCVRAYIEGAVEKKSGFAKWFYIGPMFRSERPQAGRLRQFTQLGAEALGSYNPFLDAEMISLASHILKECGIEGTEVRLNTLGCEKDKVKFADILRRELKGRLKSLCRDCNQRYKRNILRVFDCKKSLCIKTTRALPKISSYLCGDCSKHFSAVKKALDKTGISYKIDDYIVRGLDYYTKTVFEITHPKLGAKDVIGAGGRYDRLVGEMGGAETGAVGFAIGVERMLIARGTGEDDRVLGRPDICIATIGEEAYLKGFELLSQLREKNIPSDIDYTSRSIKAQLRQANRVGAKAVAIIGEDELRKNMVILKDMSTSQQREMTFAEFISEVCKR